MPSWRDHDDGFRRQLEGLHATWAWTRQVQQFIARLLTHEAVAHRIGLQLSEWRRAFASLSAEAEQYMNLAGVRPLDPGALSQLLTRAQHQMNEFMRFLQGSQVPQKEIRKMESLRSVPIGEHTLPPLPYPYDALEPHIDAETMRLHHDKHHKAYVDGLNKAEQMMARARETNDFNLLRTWERDAAFNGAGHYLHTIFWKVMSPNGGGEPSGALAEQIRRDFGGLARFRAHFSAAAEQVEGGGWAILVWSPRPRRLEILQAEKHQNLSQWDVIPLLPLDVWEHAYYLKYQNDRKAYIGAWWNVVNWPHVADRFEQARKVAWEPF